MFHKCSTTSFAESAGQVVFSPFVQRWRAVWGKAMVARQPITTTVTSARSRLNILWIDASVLEYVLIVSCIPLLPGRRQVEGY